MAFIAAGMSFDSLARILRAAALLSPNAWESSGAGDDAKKPAAGGPGDLSSDLHELFKLLHDRKIAYLLVGGVALLKYVDGRNTEDIDLVVSVAAMQALPEIVIADRNENFAHGHFRGVRVDLLLASNPVFKLAQDQYATRHRFGEFEVPCATVDGLALLKLYALPDLYAQGKLQRALLYENDLAMLCQKHKPDLKMLLSVLRRHVDAGPFQELIRIADEIEARVARMTGRR